MNFLTLYQIELTINLFYKNVIVIKISNKTKMLDDLPFIYPADFQKAQRHRLASRIFKGLSEQNNNLDRCQCCERRVGQKGNSKNCWYSPIYDLIFLGPGVPLLFVFVQNAMLILALLTGIFFFYAFVTNILGKSCEFNSKCVVDVFNELSISNKISDKQSLMIQTYLVSVFILGYIIFSHYMIFRIRRKNDKCDQIINSPSDYSIIIKNLPENVQKSYIEEMIEQVRINLDQNEKQETKNLRIKKIIISYALQNYLKEKKQQEQEFLQLKKQDIDAQFKRKNIIKPTTTASFALVVFDTQSAKQVFFNRLSVKNNWKNMVAINCCQQIQHFKVNGKEVIVQRAPQPDDILWQNADVPKSRRFRNIFLAYFFGIILLASGGVIQYYLQYFQNQISEIEVRANFSYATSIIVTVFNALIIQFLIFVTNLEGRQTKTDKDRSLLIKNCLYSFFNAGIFYSAANILAQSLNKFDIHGSFAFQITLFMSLNAITPNVTSLIINKVEFPSILFRLMARMGCCKYSQAEANKLYEYGEVDFPVKYAYVIRTIWLTCFYAPFVPVVVPISIFGLIFFYFTEAELFRSSYRAPNMLSISITRTAMRLLDFTGVTLSIGQILIVFYIKFIFGTEFTLNEQIGIGLCTGLSVVLIFLPSQKINQKFFPIDADNDNPIDYDDALKEFEITYEGSNPLSDPSQRMRNNQHNLFKYMNVMDVFGSRRTRADSKSNANPFANLFRHSKQASSTNQPQQNTNLNQSNPFQMLAFNNNPTQSIYPAQNAQQNYFNNYNQSNPFNQFNQYNHLGNPLL